MEQWPGHGNPVSGTGFPRSDSLHPLTLQPPKSHGDYDYKNNCPETALHLFLGSKTPGKWHLTRVGRFRLQSGVWMGSGDRHCLGARRDCSALTYPGLSSREDTILFNLVWLSGRMTQ